MHMCLHVCRRVILTVYSAFPLVDSLGPKFTAEDSGSPGVSTKERCKNIVFLPFSPSLFHFFLPFSFLLSLVHSPSFSLRFSPSHSLSFLSSPPWSLSLSLFLRPSSQGEFIRDQQRLKKKKIIIPRYHSHERWGGGGAVEGAGGGGGDAVINARVSEPYPACSQKSPRLTSVIQTSHRISNGFFPQAFSELIHLKRLRYALQQNRNQGLKSAPIRHWLQEARIFLKTELGVLGGIQQSLIPRPRVLSVPVHPSGGQIRPSSI